MAGERIAIVTGAAGGIGSAIVRRLAGEGYRVVATDLSAGGVEAARSAQKSGSPVDWRQLDVCDEAAAARLIASLPSLQLLVNNAGLFEVKPMADISAADFRRINEINALSGFLIGRLAAAKMQDDRGRIVNIASRAYLGAQHYVHYVASKAALVGITRAMAMELASRGILVNAIAPGAIDTPMLDAWGPQRRAALAAQQPLGRLGSPQDIARAVSFLGSEENRYISGQVLLVDGGKSLGGITG